MSDFEEYPKAMHGPDGAEATVNSAEEEEALGDGWIDGHEHWAAQAAGVEAGEDAEDESVAPKKRGRKKKDAEE